VGVHRLKNPLVQADIAAGLKPCAHHNSLPFAEVIFFKTVRDAAAVGGGRKKDKDITLKNMTPLSSNIL
jgi:hypothetical protein